MVLNDVPLLPVIGGLVGTQYWGPTITILTENVKIWFRSTIDTGRLGATLFFYNGEGMKHFYEDTEAGLFTGDSMTLLDKLKEEYDRDST